METPEGIHGAWSRLCGELLERLKILVVAVAPVNWADHGIETTAWAIQDAVKKRIRLRWPGLSKYLENANSSGS